MAAAYGGQWGDVDEEEEYNAVVPGRIESEVDANGIKTVTEYQTNDKGQKVKVVKKVRMVPKKVVINIKVQERRKWVKFGKSEGAGPGLEDGVTVPSSDEVRIEPPARKKEESTDVTPRTASAVVVVCRTCGRQGDHWTLQCPYKGMDLSAIKAEGAKAGGADAQAASSSSSASASASAPGKYVPPSMRGGAAARSDGPVEGRRDDVASVRVTNLSEDVKESDLMELFRDFGPIQKIFLARDINTGLCKGYAFVHFYERESAVKAIDKLNNHGYDHLILKVEFAKEKDNRFK